MNNASQSEKQAFFDPQMYKNRQHPTEVECRLFCCPILLGRCRFCSFLKLLFYRHTPELTFFIIDNDKYGYSSDAYKGRIEVGRLISGEDVRFITARDHYAIASYAAEVSEEALELWKNYESDKLSIVESLRGVNGYAFYPDVIAAKRQDLR